MMKKLFHPYLEGMYFRFLIYRVGNIVKINLPMKKKKNLGFVKIEYEKPLEAVRALNLFHGDTLEGMKNPMIVLPSYDNE